eukprot:TRINITY_DN3857_c0_g3_i1.p1 TRINITY_DN3857_c0_g3~~TRINITY_DN3857_c0_g3_i1.p1  ORF type:complete len:273 (+),score=75.45 TRINITY_DN3857_c0_g3_i1:108-926(+)
MIIGDGGDQATAEAVSEAVAESMLDNSQSAGQALGTLCGAGEPQIAASAQAVAQAVSKGNTGVAAEAYAEALGSVSTDEGTVKGVAQAGAQAIGDGDSAIAQVIATACVQTADGGFIEATATAIAQIAVSKGGVVFVEAIARAIADLGDGCFAIAEAVSQAKIINGQIAEVIAETQVTIESDAPPPEVVPVAPSVSSPIGFPTEGPQIDCGSVFTLSICQGAQETCCEQGFAQFGDVCQVGDVTYTYEGFCNVQTDRILLVASQGRNCYCQA